MQGRIYKPGKTATQSGPSARDVWRLEIEPQASRSIDPLMGWTSNTDMTRQLKLEFATREAALAYAAENGIAARVEEGDTKRAFNLRQLGYGDNFRSDRKETWTH